MASAILAAALLLPGAALAAQPPGGSSGCLSAVATAREASLVKAQSDKTAANRKAHAAYKRKLWRLRKSQGTTDPPASAFVDLTGDGVDEMVVAWWPSVYTYRGGKAVRVEKGFIGSDGIYRVYRRPHVILKKYHDKWGGFSYTYKKWSGRKFETVATLYTPGSLGVAQGAEPSYWTKADGDTSRAVAEAYAEALVGSARASKAKYRKNW